MKTIDGCDLCSIRRRFSKYRNRCGPDMCWEWSGGRTSAGYGGFWINGQTIGAHVVAFFLKHGEWPKNGCVMHTCDNPPCVNPAHLRDATDKDNALDRKAKGRGYRPMGMRHHNVKMSPSKVREVRRLLGLGWTQSSVAKLFGVSRSCILAIHRGDNWSHVT